MKSIEQITISKSFVYPRFSRAFPELEPPRNFEEIFVHSQRADLLAEGLAARQLIEAAVKQAKDLDGTPADQDPGAGRVVSQHEGTVIHSNLALRTSVLVGPDGPFYEQFRTGPATQAFQMVQREGDEVHLLRYDREGADDVISVGRAPLKDFDTLQGWLLQS